MKRKYVCWLSVWNLELWHLSCQHLKIEADTQKAELRSPRHWIEHPWTTLIFEFLLILSKIYPSFFKPISLYFFFDMVKTSIPCEPLSPVANYWLIAAFIWCSGLNSVVSSIENSVLVYSWKYSSLSITVHLTTLAFISS